MTDITRRVLLKALPLGTLPAAAKLSAATVARAPKQTVRGVEVFHVKVNHRGNWILLRLRSSAGLTGLGDASHGGDAECLRFVKQFASLLEGESIYQVERFRLAVAPVIAEHGTAAAVAASGLEQCLWDLQGKAAGLPVYDLFGGRVHERIRNYANINRSVVDRTPEGFAQMAQKAIDAGFTAVKLAPFDGMPKDLADAAAIERFTRLGLDCAAAVRRVIGPRNDLLIDVHSHFDRERGLELAKRFEPLNLFWLEEVTPAKPVDNLAAINRAAKMPTAGGESIIGVKGFYPYIKAEAVDIVMPDVKMCGGLFEMKKIAAMAEGAGLLVSPHGPASPIGNVAAAHVSATLPNFHILEFAYGEVPWRSELIEPAETVVKGNFALSDAPGFGVELNEKTAAKHAV